MGALVGALVLTAVALTLRRDGAGPVRYASAGLVAGLIGGALGGAAYMVLKDQDIVRARRCCEASRPRAPAPSSASRCPRSSRAGARSSMLAGLAGGLVGGILAQSIIGDTGQTRGVGKVLFETLVAIGVDRRRRDRRRARARRAQAARSRLNGTPRAAAEPRVARPTL